MDDFLKMDIFFVVTTISIIAIGTLLFIGLRKVLRILDDVEHISKNVSEESDALKKDVDELRSKVREEGMKLKNIKDLALSVNKY